jgi:hypothetical protein
VKPARQVRIPKGRRCQGGRHVGGLGSVSTASHVLHLMHVPGAAHCCRSEIIKTLFFYMLEWKPPPGGQGCPGLAVSKSTGRQLARTDNIASRAAEQGRGFRLSLSVSWCYLVLLPAWCCCLLGAAPDLVMLPTWCGCLLSVRRCLLRNQLRGLESQNKKNWQGFRRHIDLHCQSGLRDVVHSNSSQQGSS